LQTPPSALENEAIGRITGNMRPLTESETQTLFAKLANYTGTSLKNLIAPLDNGPNADRYVFRIQQSRCYYVRLSLANLATSISRDKLLSLGTCLGMAAPLTANIYSNVREGKFTKTGKFRLHITALPILAEHARYKVWVKANGEMPFLYGGHIVKAHVGRWSDDCPEHQGVVVYSMNDTPLGFGVTARSTQEARRLDPTGITCFRQADCGEYLRDEDSLFATS
jgi:60S ribosome subunit biogenesis protein NIP7